MRKVKVKVKVIVMVAMAVCALSAFADRYVGIDAGLSQFGEPNTYFTSTTDGPIKKYGMPLSSGVFMGGDIFDSPIISAQYQFGIENFGAQEYRGNNSKKNGSLSSSSVYARGGIRKKVSWGYLEGGIGISLMRQNFYYPEERSVQSQQIQSILYAEAEYTLSKNMGIGVAIKYITGQDDVLEDNGSIQITNYSLFIKYYL